MREGEMEMQLPTLEEVYLPHARLQDPGADCGYAASDTNLLSPKSPHKADSTTLEHWEQMIDNVLSAARLTTSRSCIPVLNRAIMTGQCALEVHPP